MEHCRDGQLDGDKMERSFLISSSSLSLSILPSLHPSSKAPHPLDLTSACSLRDTSFRKLFPPVIYVQNHCRIQTSQTWHHLYSHDNQPPPLHLPCDYPPGGWPWVVGAAEICHSSRGLKLNVAAKLLQNRCWHKSGRFRKLTWPWGFGGRIPEDRRK